jgi:hypothetical protein
MGILTIDAIEKLKVRVETVIQDLSAFQERVALAEYDLLCNPDMDAARAEWQEMDPASTLREGVTQGWRFMFRVEHFSVSSKCGREMPQGEADDDSRFMMGWDGD